MEESREKIKNRRICEKMILVSIGSTDLNHPPLLLSILLFNFIIDNGFCCVEDNVNAETGIPNNWLDSAQNIYKCKFQAVGYKDCVCEFVAIASDDVFIINFVSHRTKNVFTETLSIKRYVPCPYSKAVLTKFAFFNQLESLFKENLVIPARSSELLAAGFTSGSLLGLPEEIIRNIMLYSGGIASVNLSSVCTRFRNISKDNIVWYNLARNDFPLKFKETQYDDSVNFYKEYREYYIFEMNKKRNC